MWIERRGTETKVHDSKGRWLVGVRAQTSWCSCRIAQLLGRSGNGRQDSLPPFSQLDAPLTAQHLHRSLAVLNTSTLRRSEGGSIQHPQQEMKMLDCERYTRFGSAGSRRKMV